MLGTCDAGTRSAGYTVITADSLDEAVALAERCPFPRHRGGIEVGVIPPDA